MLANFSSSRGRNCGGGNVLEEAGIPVSTGWGKNMRQDQHSWYPLSNTCLEFQVRETESDIIIHLVTPTDHYLQYKMMFQKPENDNQCLVC